MAFVLNRDNQVALENAVIRRNGKGSNINAQVVGNDSGYVVNQPLRVHALYVQECRKPTVVAVLPFGHDGPLKQLKKKK